MKTLLRVGALTSIKSKTAGTAVDLCVNSGDEIKAVLMMHDRLSVGWTFGGWLQMQHNAKQWPEYAQQGYTVMLTLMLVAQHQRRCCAGRRRCPRRRGMP